jgi:hypothetical protein
MSEREKIEDQWRAVLKQAVDKCFKLGSIFYWPQEKHFFIYLGPAEQSGAHSFFVMASSQPYRDTKRNFAIVPEDFRSAKQGTKSRAFIKTTYFLFSEYLNYRFETAKLREIYVSGKLEYKFNLKTDLPDAYERLEYFIKNNLPPAYAKRFLDTTNVLPDKALQ